MFNSSSGITDFEGRRHTFTKKQPVSLTYICNICHLCPKHSDIHWVFQTNCSNGEHSPNAYISNASGSCVLWRFYANTTVWSILLRGIP